MSDGADTASSKKAVIPVIPIATRGKRLFCAALDFVVISIISLALVTRYFWPKYYPETVSLIEEMQGVPINEQMSYAPQYLPENEAQGMIVFLLVVMAMVTWFYFMVSETFSRGGSLGKSVFGLRVMSLRGAPPNALEAGVRASIKALGFLLFVPALLILNVIVMVMNRQRRSLHDMMARTVVVASRPPQKPPPKPNDERPE